MYTHRVSAGAWERYSRQATWNGSRDKVY